MSWDELQLVPPTTSKLKVALQGLFSEEGVMDFAGMFQTWLNVLTRPGEAVF